MTPSPLKNYESSKVHLETGEKSTSQETSNIVVPTDKCDDPSFFSGLSKSNTPDRIQTALGDEDESEKESSNIQLNKLSDNGKEPQLSQATETVVFTKPNLPSYVGNGQSKRSSGETPFSYMTLASSKRSGALDSETFLNQSNKLLQSSQAFYFGSERAVTRATFHPSDATSSSYPRNTFSFESETHAPVFLGNKKISCAYDKASRIRSTSESRNENIFGDILGRDSLSFRDLASKNETRTAFRSLGTTETDFPGFGKPVFSVPDDDRKEGQDTRNEANIDFKPIVSLPLVKNQVTGEEGELTKFSERAKLFRFDSANKEWKERGVGKIKLLYDPSSGKSRVVMRREQVHKLCANHFILPSMKLKANRASNRSWLWHTHADVSDGDPKAEQLAVKFKQEETASQFKKLFEALQSICPTSNDLIADQDTSTNMSVAPDSQSAAPRSQLNDDLKVQFQPPPSSWSCDTRMVQNSSESTQCVACQIPKTGLSQPIQQPKFSFAQPSSFSFGSPAPVLPTISQTNNGAKSSFNAGFTFASPSFSFGSQTSKDKAPKCETLKLSDFSIGGGNALRNEKKFEKSPFVISLQKSNSDLSKTPSQDMKNKNKKLDPMIYESQNKEKSLKDLLTQPNLTLAFQPAKRSWECDRCLVRNAPQSNVCAACHSSKPGTQPAVTNSGVSFSAGISPGFRFGANQTNKVSSVGNSFNFNPGNVSKHLSQRSGFKDTLKGPSFSSILSNESKDVNNKSGVRFRTNESSKAAGSGFNFNASVSTNLAINTKKLNLPFQPAKGSWECNTCSFRNTPKLNASVACQSPKPGTQPSVAKYGSDFNSGTSCGLSFSTVNSNSARSAETGFNFRPSNVCKDPSQKSGFSFGASNSAKAAMSSNNLNLASKPRQDNSSNFATDNDDLKVKFLAPEGTWDCDVCMVRNDKQSNSCVACKSPKPGAEQTNASLNSNTFAFGQSFPKQGGFAFGPSATTQSNVLPSGGFRQSFKSKAPVTGTDPSQGSIFNFARSDERKDVISKSASSFGASDSTKAAVSTNNLKLAFQPPERSWECDTCLVRNEPESDVCVACQSSKPGTQPTVANSGFGFCAGTSSGFSFGTDHSTKACSAATGFNFSSSNVSKDPSQRSGFSFGASNSTKAAVNTNNLNLASKRRQNNSSNCATGNDDVKLKFQASKGAWDCDVCMVRNDKQSNSCLACKTPKPGVVQTSTSLNSNTFTFGQSFPKQGGFAFSPLTTTQSNVPPSGGFTFGQALGKGFTLRRSSKDNQRSGFSFGAPGSSVSTSLLKDTGNFTFGHSKSEEGSTLAFTFGLDDISKGSCSGSVTSGQSGFGFADGQTNQSAFRFGGEQPFGFGKLLDDTTGGNLSLENKKPSERCTKENEDVFKDVPKVEDSTNILSQGTFTFRLDIPKQLTMTSPGNKDVSEEIPDREDDCVVFKPIVSLRNQVDGKTGEEGETTLFSSRAKLYRFTQNSWKERGVGEIKVLHDRTRQRGRVVMRRDQVHVLCANHFITNDMELIPQGSSGKSWLWHVQGDFAENKAKEQLFAVKFGDTKTALAFKCAFQECLDHKVSPLSQDVVEDEVIVLSEVSVTEEQRARATKFLSPPNFYAYENQNEIAPQGKQDGDKT